MTYLYEQLTPDRFQYFCQALLTAKFPNAQCLPVGQPDGGRDAYLWSIADTSRDKSELIVFQVKFSRDADRANDDFIGSIRDSELPKVERLKSKGISAYYLLTNVKGSAHLEHGSIDKVDAILSAAFDLPAYCWWRDDLDRRVDSESDIKWSYPEIIRGTDLLQALFEGKLGEDGRRRDAALRAYIAAQYDDDEEVKFKQVDLYNDLVDLFVDTSVYLSPLEDGRRGIRQKANWGSQFEEPYLSDQGEEPLAAQLFLRSDVYQGFPKSVLEGAPGQRQVNNHTTRLPSAPDAVAG